MIPSGNEILTELLEIETLPSTNYMMHIDQSYISGYCDKKEAVRQAIYKILNTERYENIIYSWNYGVELKDLYGEPISYVCPELVRRISEALVVDDRINSCTDFDFDTSKRGIVSVTFTANTVFGEVEAGKEVKI